MGLRKPTMQLPVEVLPSQEASTRKTYDVEIVTPLFGGGVSPGVVDSAMPYRVSSIRGQLRFWWRIAHGPFQSAAEMFKREVAVWGGLEEKGARRSKVRIRVESKSLAAGAISQYPAEKPGEPYALGPAFNKTTALLRENAAFKLHVECAQDVAGEFEVALRWWSSFGGLGARTRRGLGAVRVQGLLPITVAEVARVQGRIALRAADKDAGSAWSSAISRLQRFRQGVNVGRNGSGSAVDFKSPPGRSRWPEPDTLRELARTSSKRHQERQVQGNFFPRAAFGLPIIFHFKDGKAGDPQDHTLQPEKAERMASPLILRPYWNGEAWQPAALLLPGWQTAISQPLAFAAQSYRPAAWPAEVAERRTAAERISPMRGRGEDALSAFMTYFVEGT